MFEEHLEKGLQKKSNDRFWNEKKFRDKKMMFSVDIFLIVNLTTWRQDSLVPLQTFPSQVHIEKNHALKTEFVFKNVTAFRSLLCYYVTSFQAFTPIIW